MNKLFIVGVGRSGTSLLQAMLASHPRIYFLPETAFFRRFVMTHEFSDQSADTVLATLQNDSRLKRLDRNIEEIFNRVQENAFVEKAFYDTLFETEEDLAFFGDKDPRNVEYANPILSLWPDARLIHIYRDPRDILASKKKAQWSKDKSLFFHLVAGAAQFALACDTTQQSSIYRLQYESLIRDPTGELQKLCDWLSIKFDASMESFSSEAKRLVSDDEMQWKGETLGPLLKNNSGKWKDSLSPMEIVAVETASARAMSSGSYSVTQSEKNLATLAGKVVGLAARFVAFIYCCKRKWTNRNFVRQIAK